MEPRKKMRMQSAHDFMNALVAQNTPAENESTAEKSGESLSDTNNANEYAMQDGNKEAQDAIVEMEQEEVDINE